MKRFLLFAGTDYYPEGGWRDFMSSHNTLEDAHASVGADKWNWMHVVDTTTMSICSNWNGEAWEKML